MPGTLKARVSSGVHVQQIARTGPLVAAGSITRRSRAPRETMAVQHLPDRRVWMTGRASDQSWPPAGALPCFADPVLGAEVQQPRRATGTAGTISRPRQRVSLG